MKRRPGDVAVSLQSAKNVDGYHSRSTTSIGFPFNNSYKNQLVEKMPPMPSLWHARCCFEKK